MDYGIIAEFFSKLRLILDYYLPPTDDLDDVIEDILFDAREALDNILEARYRRALGMAEFCEICRSLVIDGSCTNKRCQKHIRGTEYVTYRQIEYIRYMLVRLEDDTEYDFRNMTQKEANRIIQELQERLERSSHDL